MKLIESVCIWFRGRFRHGAGSDSGPVSAWSSVPHRFRAWRWRVITFMYPLSVITSSRNTGIASANGLRPAPICLSNSVLWIFGRLNSAVRCPEIMHKFESAQCSSGGKDRVSWRLIDDCIHDCVSHAVVAIVGLGLGGWGVWGPASLGTGSPACQGQLLGGTASQKLSEETGIARACGSLVPTGQMVNASSSILRQIDFCVCINTHLETTTSDTWIGTDKSVSHSSLCRSGIRGPPHSLLVSPSSLNPAKPPPLFRL